MAQVERAGFPTSETFARAQQAEVVARRFHEVYETLAPHYGYETRPESAVPWEKVPENNQSLMRATVAQLLYEGVISGSSLPSDDEATPNADVGPDSR